MSKWWHSSENDEDNKEPNKFILEYYMSDMGFKSFSEMHYIGEDNKFHVDVVEVKIPVKPIDVDIAMEELKDLIIDVETNYR